MPEPTSKEADTQQTGPQICTACGASFRCGMAAGDAVCWCFELPHVMPVPEGGSGCLCPDCLRQRIQAQRDDNTRIQ